MKFVLALLLTAIHSNLSVGDRRNDNQCNRARDRLLEIDEQCATIRNCCLESDYDCPESLLIERCNCPSDSLEPCMTVTVTATDTVTYAPPAPSSSTTTTVITEHLSITPTNCLQSTHTKEMSTTVGTGNPDTVTGRATNNSCPRIACNSSPVILAAVLAALLVAVTTGWIVTCVVNRRKDKASTTRADTGTDYDVIDRSGPHPPTTHPVPISDQDYSTLDTDEQEHDYHVLESTNA